MLQDLFTKLDSSIEDMTSKKKIYDDLEAQTGSAYKNYIESYKVSLAIRNDIQSALGNVLPSAVPDRVRIA